MRPPVAAPEHLGAIWIEGNHAIASDALAPALALNEAMSDGAAVDPSLVSLDTERIRAAYFRRGFFAAKVTADVRREATGQVVVFTVVEGRRAVARVEITGLPPEAPAADARGLVALGDGAPFDYDAYDAAKQPLTALVENAGYARAEVHGTVDADPVAAVATVRYEVVPGVRCAFGEIRLTGYIRPELVAAVRARLRFATGDRYSAQALADSQAEIYRLGRFSSVQVVPDRRGDGPTIDAEHPSGELTLAAPKAAITRLAPELGGAVPGDVTASIELADGLATWVFVDATAGDARLRAALRGDPARRTASGLVSAFAIDLARVTRGRLWAAATRSPRWRPAPTAYAAR